MPFLGVRTKERTENLHKRWLKCFLDKHPQYKDLVWKTEEKLPCSLGRTFQVDIVGYNDEGLPVVVLLDKAYNNNVLQNIYNYFNTSFGEIDRLFLRGCNPSVESLYFLNLIPAKTIFFDKNNNKKRVEDVKARLADVEIDACLEEKGLEKKKHIEQINLYYDINNLSTIVSKKDLYDFKITETYSR